MRIRKNGKVIRLTESDLMRITRKVLREQEEKSVSSDPMTSKEAQEMKKTEQKVSKSCGNFKKVGKPFEGRMMHRGEYFVQLFVFQRSNFE